MSKVNQTSRSYRKSMIMAINIALVIIVIASLAVDAKFLRRSRYFDDYSNGYDGYGSNMPTGERAIVTVRGARSPYDGSAPSKITIEDNPYRGQYPRGVYDRLDGYGSGRYPMRADPYAMGGYGGGPYGAGGYGSMFGAPNRIAVTGAFPYGYGSRF